MPCHHERRRDVQRRQQQQQQQQQQPGSVLRAIHAMTCHKKMLHRYTIVPHSLLLAVPRPNTQKGTNKQTRVGEIVVQIFSLEESDNKGSLNGGSQQNDGELSWHRSATGFQATSLRNVRVNKPRCRSLQRLVSSSTHHLSNNDGHNRKNMNARGRHVYGTPRDGIGLGSVRVNLSKK